MQKKNPGNDHIIELSLSDLIDGIEVDPIELLPKKSENFVQKVIKDTKGNLIVNEPIHNVMHRFIRFARSKKYNRFLILGGFGVGKTENMCIGWVLDQIARNPNILVKIVHVSDTAASARVGAIKNYIENDEDFKRLAPHIKQTSTWGTNKITVERKAPSPNGTAEAYSVLSTGIGGRANLIVFDDPQDLRTAVYEPTTRQKIEETIKNIWLTRLIPEDSEALVIMNKWCKEDLAGSIQRNPTWAWMSLSVSKDLGHYIYEDNFGRTWDLPLWSKFTTEHLKQKKSELGERDFDRGFRLVPYSDADKTFSFFGCCCHFGIDPRTVVVNESNWVFIGGIDFSGTKRPGTVLQIIAMHRITGLKVPVYLKLYRKSSDLVNGIVETFKEFGVELYMAENNGVQDVIIDLLSTALGETKYKKYNIKIEGFLTGRNKIDNVVGLPSIDKELEKREWMFCYPCLETDLIIENIEKDPWAKHYQEHFNHPFFSTTDIVMTTWFCREGAKRFIREEDDGPNIY